MTGFGRGIGQSSNVSVSVELKSVNHRFAEFHIRVPREWMFLEEDIRRVLGSSVFRGRVDAFVNVEGASVATDVDVNWGLVEALIHTENRLAERFGGEKRTEEVRDWLKYPGVIQIAEQKLDEAETADVVRLAVKEALKELVELRMAEGNRIEDSLVEKLKGIEQQLAVVKSHEESAISSKTEWLKSRFAQLSVELDPDRLTQEVVLLVDRSAVDEEIVRLASHIQGFRDALHGDGAMGRRLDFIVQEMHREVNTIGSKSSDARIGQAVVEMKVLVEQLREQVQNVE